MSEHSARENSEAFAHSLFHSFLPLFAIWDNRRRCVNFKIVTCSMNALFTPSTAWRPQYQPCVHAQKYYVVAIMAAMAKKSWDGRSVGPASAEWGMGKY